MSGAECVLTVHGELTPRVQSLLEQHCGGTFSDDGVMVTPEGIRFELDLWDNPPHYLVAVQGPDKDAVGTELYKLLCKETPHAIRANGVFDEIGRRPAIAKTD